MKRRIDEQVNTHITSFSLLLHRLSFSFKRKNLQENCIDKLFSLSYSIALKNYFLLEIYQFVTCVNNVFVVFEDFKED